MSSIADYEYKLNRGCNVLNHPIPGLRKENNSHMIWFLVIFKDEV